MATKMKNVDLFRFQKSERNGNILIVYGHEYKIDRKRGTNAYYKCTEKGCTARAVYRMETKKVFINDAAHNHSSNENSIARREFNNAFKQDIKLKISTPVPQVFLDTRRNFANEGVAGISNDDLQAAMVIFDNVRSTGYRSRAELMPKLPEYRSSISLDGRWTQTNDSRPFLLATDGDADKIIIFATQQFLQFLCNADTVYMDGTFKASPPQFYQVYSLHCLIHGIMVPTAYCLLPNKTSETYCRMFRLIQLKSLQFGYTFEPKKFQIDYENGVINAIKSVFGDNTEIKGCMFHFSQSILRRVTENGLKARYSSDINFKKFIKRIMGMPLVPISSCSSCWLLVKLEAPNDNVCDEIQQYFEKNYLDTTARFNINMWNHYSTDNARTINNVEGWHNCLNRSVNRHKPNIFQFIDCIKNQQDNFELDIMAAENGNKKKRRAKYERIEQALAIHKHSLEAGQIDTLKYLDIIKYMV